MAVRKGRCGGAVLLLAIILQSITVLGQQKTPDCNAVRQLLQTIRAFHVAPAAEDTVFGQRVLHQLIGGLDPWGLYLTQEDVNYLLPHFKNIDEQAANNNCRFSQEAHLLFADRYRYADSLRQVLLKQPIRWDKSDTIRIFFQQTPLVANKKELIKRWEQQLKYMLLQEAYTDADGKALQAEKLQSMREHVLQRLNCRRSRMLDTPDGLHNYVEEHIMEALASAFDPHTNFFPASLKQQFEASLSVEAASFGIELDDNRQGDILIGNLIPGGPAWKSNELHHGDILLSLSTKSGIEKSFTCANLEEASRLLNEAANPHIFLTVRKKNGKTKTVELQKEKLKVEENVVQSFVLAGEQKVGYISLPGFYTQWDEQGREMGCANDVAKELIKLKQAAVSGIILDLRYNGGGSVKEALSLAGIFIDEGPLGIEQMRGEKPRLLKDLNRGTLYDAPLILLVNGFSASASEIMAQALQNYNRAVIVGSKTFGKASMQSLIPLNATAVGYQQKDDEDFVKITISRYYNVKGSTYQYQGVVPDVTLEDGLSALGQHESAYPTALLPDAIQKQVVYHPLPQLPVKQLAASSKMRLQQNNHYQQQHQQVQALYSAFSKGLPIRLTPQGFQQDYSYLNKLTDQEKDTVKASVTSFSLQTLTGTEQLLALKPEQKEAHELIVKALKQDPWLEESYHIMLDMLKIKK